MYTINCGETQTKVFVLFDYIISLQKTLYVDNGTAHPLMFSGEYMVNNRIKYADVRDYSRYRKVRGYFSLEVMENGDKYLQHDTMVTRHKVM